MSTVKRRHQMLVVDDLTKCACGEPVAVIPNASPAENWAAHAAQAVDRDRLEGCS